MAQIPPANRVTDEIRVAMTRRRLSQTALAEAIGMSQQALSRRLVGSTPFNIPELESVAAALDVSVSSFFPDEGRAAS